jgi:hypothetical protein
VEYHLEKQQKVVLLGNTGDVVDVVNVVKEPVRSSGYMRNANNHREI